MPRTNTPRPRSTLPPNRALLPEFGARHPIIFSEKVDSFFGEVFLALDEVVPDDVRIDDHAKITGTIPLFRLYDHPNRIGVSVMEKRLPRMYAAKQRLRWSRNDVGRVMGEIQDEIARLELADSPLTATFTNVVRLGAADQDANARKLGLIIDQESTVAEFLVREHAIVVNGISSRLKSFKYPYENFVPHWTPARINRNVSTEILNKAVGVMQELLPVTVTLEPIHLYATQDVPLSDVDW